MRLLNGLLVGRGECLGERLERLFHVVRDSRLLTSLFDDPLLPASLRELCPRKSARRRLGASPPDFQFLRLVVLPNSRRQPRQLPFESQIVYVVHGAVVAPSMALLSLATLGPCPSSHV